MRFILARRLMFLKGRGGRRGKLTVKDKTLGQELTVAGPQRGRGRLLAQLFKEFSLLFGYDGIKHHGRLKFHSHNPATPLGGVGKKLNLPQGSLKGLPPVSSGRR